MASLWQDSIHQTHLWINHHCHWSLEELPLHNSVSNGKGSLWRQEGRARRKQKDVARFPWKNKDHQKSFHKKICKSFSTYISGYLLCPWRGCCCSSCCCRCRYMIIIVVCKWYRVNKGSCWTKEVLIDSFLLVGLETVMTRAWATDNIKQNCRETKSLGLKESDLKHVGTLGTCCLSCLELLYIAMLLSDSYSTRTSWNFESRYKVSSLQTMPFFTY